MGGLGLTNYNPSMLFDSSFEFLICLCFHPNKTEFIYNSLVYASVHSSVFRSMSSSDYHVGFTSILEVYTYVKRNLQSPSTWGHAHY